MVSSLRYDMDLNDPTAFQFNYRSDICSMSSSTIPIIHNPTPYHHQKEIDIASEYLAMNGTFTDLLATDNEQLMEAYRMMSAPPSHATTCSSPASDNYNLFGQKIKMEFEPLEPSMYDMARTLSSESCPDLAVCPTSISTPLTPPVDSPQDQSPIMTPTILHHNQYHHHHHQQQQQQQQQQQSPPPQHHIISEEREIMTNQVMMQPTTSKRGRGRRSTTNTAINTGIQLQNPAEFHPLMTSPSLPQKTGKSRGRRMSNKPAKPGTKSFECTYANCGRIFKRSEHLKRHIRSIHTLERPFHCPHPHCTKRFSRSDNLSQHVRVHRPNGKEKNATARTFSNFTPFLQTYQTGNLHSSLQ